MVRKVGLEYNVTNGFILNHQQLLWQLCLSTTSIRIVWNRVGYAGKGMTLICCLQCGFFSERHIEVIHLRPVVKKGLQLFAVMKFREFCKPNHT